MPIIQTAYLELILIGFYQFLLFWISVSSSANFKFLHFPSSMIDYDVICHFSTYNWNVF